ncbi:MAG: T9SS type A sorting domain-containing protein [Paludibacter sp.]|nr:T9SS type A sorting domain-containing protein [Paludibacter sp.]
MKFNKCCLSFFLLFSSCFVLQAGNYESDFQARSQIIIDYLADNYFDKPSGWYDCNNPSDYGKYNWQVVVASFHKYGVNNAKGNTFLPHFDTPSCIQNRFHFNLVGETYIFTKYWSAPSVKSTVKDYLTAAWNRKDSYNLLTSEGTENHTNMTRTSAYLYAQIARDSFPTLFPNAQSRMDSAKIWIKNWSKSIYAFGTGEWNSSTYIPYSVIGWLSLYDGAKDIEVKNAARAVLDYYACELALHYTQGLTGGYESRNGSGYESIVTQSDYLAWLWYGNSPKKISFTAGAQNEAASQIIYAAASTYRPPIAALKLANKQLTKDVMYYNSKGEYLLNNPGVIKQTFYIGKSYTLGAAYLPYGGFVGGDTQIQAWKFVGQVTPNETTTAKTANIIVGYGSKEWNKARNRMPWDQLVHHKNVLIQLTKVPANYTALTNQVISTVNQWKTSWTTDFAKRFPGENKPNPVNYSTADVVNTNISYMAVWKKNSTVTTVTNGNVVFYEMDLNYAAIRSIAQTAPTVIAAATDNYGLKDAAASGLCGLILEVASKQDYSSFSAFQSAIITNSSLNKTDIATDKIVYTSALGDVISVQYNSSGSFTEPLYDWGYGPVTPQLSQTSPPFIQPTWPTGEGCGRLATWTVNGKLVDLTTKTWAIFEGPHFSLKNSILKIDDGSADSLTIDYSGVLPIFKVGTNTNVENINSGIGSLKLYPNPSKGILYLELINAYSGRVSIQLIDLTGKKVRMYSKEKICEKAVFKISTSSITPGIYLVKVKVGNDIATQRIQIN